MDSEAGFRLTYEEAVSVADRQEPIEFIVHASLVPELVKWLDRRGLDLIRGPTTECCAITWYLASPRRMPHRQK